MSIVDSTTINPSALQRSWVTPSTRRTLTRSNRLLLRTCALLFHVHTNGMAICQNRRLEHVIRKRTGRCCRLTGNASSTCRHVCDACDAVRIAKGLPLPPIDIHAQRYTGDYCTPCVGNTTPNTDDLFPCFYLIMMTMSPSPFTIQNPIT
jgi:hypothetical protein